MCNIVEPGHDSVAGVFTSRPDDATSDPPARRRLYQRANRLDWTWVASGGSLIRFANLDVVAELVATDRTVGERRSAWR